MSKINNADLNHENKLIFSDYIYTDLLTQAINCITNDIAKTFKEAENYPQFKYFQHIYIFNDSVVVKQFKELFTYIIVHLFNLLKNQTNRQDINCEYLMVSVSRTYLVVTKSDIAF